MCTYHVYLGGQRTSLCVCVHAHKNVYTVQHECGSQKTASKGWTLLLVEFWGSNLSLLDLLASTFKWLNHLTGLFLLLNLHNRKP